MVSMLLVVRTTNKLLSPVTFQTHTVLPFKKKTHLAKIRFIVDVDSTIISKRDAFQQSIKAPNAQLLVKETNATEMLT